MKYDMDIQLDSKDNELIILALTIGHRREIYDR